PEGKVAVAVSGGADSMCLLALTAASFDVTAITVDHALRDGSAAEADWVARYCAANNIPHVTLTWEGDKPTANIQAGARDARYSLMMNWCREKHVQYIATAHHQDDQAETVLLRLARGSGVYGLAGMAPTRDLGDGIILVRPLLDVPKKDLLDTLGDIGQDWLEDPSNQSEAYDRVRIRNFLKAPPVEGLSAKRIAATAARMRRSRDALEYYEGQWLKTAVTVHDEAYIFLKPSLLSSEPEEVVLRGLASICRHVSGEGYVPRMEKLLRLRNALGAENFLGHTLYGVKFSPYENGTVMGTRELAAAQAPCALKHKQIWDKRFAIETKGDISGLTLTTLGVRGWAGLKKQMTSFNKIGVPRLAGIALPAVYKGEELCAVPHLGYDTLTTIEISVSPTSGCLTQK
ncbi:MAG: tRNA lysidine(34) synthetase TilS, partial [Kordiimonadaceae bacterium]|nr:tRNA lysidine(34) synthetase TilS [Kordiimonadaceae bacterium]